MYWVSPRLGLVARAASSKEYYFSKILRALKHETIAILLVVEVIDSWKKRVVVRSELIKKSVPYDYHLNFLHVFKCHQHRSYQRSHVVSWYMSQ
jgi:hypothetical protein